MAEDHNYGGIVDVLSEGYYYWRLSPKFFVNWLENPSNPEYYKHKQLKYSFTAQYIPPKHHESVIIQPTPDSQGYLEAPPRWLIIIEKEYFSEWIVQDYSGRHTVFAVVMGYDVQASLGQMITIGGYYHVACGVYDIDSGKNNLADDDTNKILPKYDLALSYSMDRDIPEGYEPYFQGQSTIDNIQLCKIEIQELPVEKALKRKIKPVTESRVSALEGIVPPGEKIPVPVWVPVGVDITQTPGQPTLIAKGLKGPATYALMVKAPGVPLEHSQ